MLIVILVTNVLVMDLFSLLMKMKWKGLISLVYDVLTRYPAGQDANIFDSSGSSPNTDTVNSNNNKKHLIQEELII